MTNSKAETFKFNNILLRVTDEFPQFQQKCCEENFEILPELEIPEIETYKKLGEKIYEKLAEEYNTKGITQQADVFSKKAKGLRESIKDTTPLETEIKLPDPVVVLKPVIKAPSIEETNIDIAIAYGLFNDNKFAEGILAYEKLFEKSQTIKNKYHSKYVELLVQNVEKCFSERKWTDCLIISKELLKLPQKPPQLYRNIGICLTELKQGELALPFLVKYAELSPNTGEPHRLLGDAAYYGQNDIENAIKHYEKFIQYDQSNALVYNMLGHLYSTKYKDQFFDKQIEYFTKAYELAPENHTIVKNLSFVYSRMKDIENTRKFYKKLFTVNPTNIDYFDYAAFLIKNRFFEEGFKYYRYRFLKETNPATYPAILTDKKRWTGKQNISKSTLLIHFEQGFGDSCMFARFIKDAVKLANKVIVVVQHNLYELFKDSNLGAEIYPSTVNLKTLQYDYHIPMMDLPIVLNLRPETMPYIDGYLDVSQDKVQYFKENYINKNDKLKIGIAFEGNPSFREYERDIKLSKLYPLAKIPNVEIYSFQVGGATEQLNNLPPDVKIINLGKNFKDFKDTAAAIKCMDLMVCTDNGVMNLSGALGHKTFGLFNKFTDYRWYKTEGEDVGWYASVKPFCAEPLNHWEVAIEKVVEEVKKLAK